MFPEVQSSLFLVLYLVWRTKHLAMTQLPGWQPETKWSILTNLYWKSIESINWNIFNVWFWKIFLKTLFKLFIDFLYIFIKCLWTLITWLQVASLEAGSWPNFTCVTQIEEYRWKSYHGEFSLTSGTTSLSCNKQ